MSITEVIVEGRTAKAEGKPAQYPGFKIERAVNGWILRELAEEYDERCSWIAGGLNELQARLSERVTSCEEDLGAGKLRIR